jgi:hypothetical protein
MVYQSQLQRNTGVIDPLIISDDIVDSYWYYVGYKTTKNFYKFYKDISPDKEGVQFGGSTTFQIPSIADKVGNMYLKFSLSAISATVPVTDHDPRYVDFIGYQAWQKIVMEYGGNEIYTIYPEECVVRMKQSYDIQRQDAIRELVAGDRTEARREALATQQQDLIVDLPFPHTRGTTRWLELIQMAVQLRITVYWRPLNAITQIGASTTGVSATLLNICMRCALVHQEGDERDNNTSRIERPDGILRLFEDIKYESFTQQLVSGTLGGVDIPIKLNNFRSSTKSLVFFLRQLNEANPGPTDVPNYTNFQRIALFSLEATDGRFFEPVEDKFNRFVQWPQWHISPAGPLMYEWSWAMEPDDVLNASGSINLGATTNLILKIQLPATLTADHILTVVGKEYNFHQQSRGDFIKTFR